MVGERLHAQLDPAPRSLVQLGYTLPLHEHGPLAAYAFYYQNAPGFPATNMTLRLAVAPVFVDAELGFHNALGPYTDLGLGIAGGGFADSHDEIRGGDYIRTESFTGHSAEFSTSLYHRFNPHDEVPLFLVLRAGIHGSFYEHDDSTADDFAVPDPRPTLFWRTGLRWGGREPYLSPKLAGELSVWYQGEWRFQDESFGFDNDRSIETLSHLLWTRGLLVYTFEPSRVQFQTSLNLGTSVRPDRFNAHGLGGTLELVSEFPLRLPGYHRNEISAEHFALLDAGFMVPIEPSRRLVAGIFGSVAAVDYLDGFEQPGNLHSGVGSALMYTSPSLAWQLGFAYTYGIDAIREDGRGAHSFSFLLQYDLDAGRRSGEEPWRPFTGSQVWRSIMRGILGGR
jgi:hypothetical protein